MAATRFALNSDGYALAARPARLEGQPETLLTAQDVAEWLNVSARWVLAHAAGLNRPVLPSVKLGKAVRFDRKDVAEFIRQCGRRYRAL